MKKLRHILTRPDKSFRHLPHVSYELFRHIAHYCHPRTAALLRQCNRKSAYAVTLYDLAVSVVRYGCLDKESSRQPVDTPANEVEPVAGWMEDEGHAACICCLIEECFKELLEEQHKAAAIEVIRAMIDSPFTIRSCGSWHKLEPVEQSAALGLAVGAELLFKTGLRATVDDLQDAAHELAKRGDVEGVKIIYRICSQIPSFIQAQHLALDKIGWREGSVYSDFVFQYALKGVEVGDHQFMSPLLTVAVELGLVDVLGELLKIEEIATSGKGIEALRTAVSNGSVEMTKMLLDHCRALDIGHSAINLAIWGKHTELVELLDKAGAMDEFMYPELAQRGDFERLYRIHRSPGVGSMVVPDVILNAVAFNQVDFLKKCETHSLFVMSDLLAVSVNETASHVPQFRLDTPQLLRVAISRGHEQVVEYLLVNSANANADDGAPLRLASRFGYCNIINSLLRHGASIIPKSNHPSPLLLAVRGGHHEAVQTLLDAGASVSFRGGETLEEAVCPSSTEIFMKSTEGPLSTLEPPPRPPRNPSILHLLITHPTIKPAQIQSTFRSAVGYAAGACKWNPYDHSRNINRKRRQQRELLDVFIQNSLVNVQAMLVAALEGHDVGFVRELVMVGLVQAPEVMDDRSLQTKLDRVVKVLKEEQDENVPQVKSKSHRVQYGGRKPDRRMTRR
ncbi:hypothetical protein HDV00_006926 [Rhizophlyctis rosea]|nr:hypothetical protein HDV00_006926 [Rhizophlyctis rosea]